MKKTEIAIVGAGPAGLSCAVEAAKAGAKVTLLDENLKPGDNYLNRFTSFSAPGNTRLVSGALE